MTYSKLDVWDKVLTNIQSIINKQSFDMWLKDTKPISLSDKILTVKVSDKVAQRHISDNYSSTASSIVSDIIGQNILCEFTTEEDNQQPENQYLTLPVSCDLSRFQPDIDLYPIVSFLLLLLLLGLDLYPIDIIFSPLGIN